MYRPLRITYRWFLREEGEDEADEEEGKREVVDRTSPFAERPSSWQERLAAQTFQPHASDGDDVGEDQSRVRDAGNRIEGHFRAKVDSSEYKGYSKADEQRVEWDFPTWRDIANPIRKREALRSASAKESLCRSARLT